MVNGSLSELKTKNELRVIFQMTAKWREFIIANNTYIWHTKYLQIYTLQNKSIQGALKMQEKKTFWDIRT